MKIKINYGTGVATLPTVALDSIDRATKADVKLLFLLCAEPSLLSGESRDACMERICRRSGCSLSRVEASLAFWRGAGVLDEDEEEGGDMTASPTAPAELTADTGTADTAAPNPTEAPAPAEPSEPAPAKEAPPAVTVTVTRAGTKMLDELPNYTADELERFFSEQKEAAGYLQECQAVWGSMFNHRDHTVIISLVNVWGFSWDYVLSLLAYANKYFQERDNQGKSLNFVYRLGISLHKEGILTDEALRQRFLEEERLRDFEHRIRAMFGLGERNLTPKEKKYFSTWLYEYKYGTDIVELAYNITVDTKGAPNMNYTNGILKHWYEYGLTTVEAIVAKRAQSDTAVRSARSAAGEGITPDNARARVEGLLAADSPAPDAPRSGNISADLNILRRLLNLGNRMLTDGENAAFTKWRTEYGFRYEIIYYAYQITLENRREYNLPYMEAILSKWHAQKLTTMEAIRAYEKGFKEDKQRKRAAAGNPTASNPTAPNAPRGDGSFETEDFFTAAVKRSLGEDFDPSVLN